MGPLRILHGGAPIFAYLPWDPLYVNSLSFVLLTINLRNCFNVSELFLLFPIFVNVRNFFLFFRNFLYIPEHFLIISLFWILINTE